MYEGNDEGDNIAVNENHDSNLNIVDDKTTDYDDNVTIKTNQASDSEKLASTAVRHIDLIIEDLRMQFVFACGGQP
jgi:hypothetical protein